MKKNLLFKILVVLVAFFAVCCGIFCYCFPLKYKDKIVNYCDIYSLDFSLVSALICVESKYNPSAKSSAGACGLMQLLPSTYAWVDGQLKRAETDADIFDPDINIEYGCYYLAYLFAKYDSEVYVLACYNAGESVVASWANGGELLVENIPYAETKNYIKKIQRLKRFYAARK
jgi:soluble lytic murein transglycosylase